MKNKTVLVLALIAVFFAGSVSFFTYNQKTVKNPTIQVKKEIQKPIVTLVLDDGEKAATYSGVSAQNAFEILSVVTEKEKIPLVTKQYDFGIFVQKIGDKESGTAMAWIYSVNGKSGEVAADKANLTTGDTVEWKYTKSIY